MAMIDWERVKEIAIELQKWMIENNYEIIDIQRAITRLSYLAEEHKREEQLKAYQTHKELECQDLKETRSPTPKVKDK